MTRDAGAGFTVVTQDVGLTHVQSLNVGAQAMTAGAAAGDFDGDGLVDLFFTRVDGTDVLYRNTGGSFVNVSVDAGFTQNVPTNGVAAGDVDNDGDLDLYVSASESPRHFLYINDGAGVFTEAAVDRGAAVAAAGSITRKGEGVALGDYDRDGFLDVLTSDHSRPIATSGSRLLRNLGAGRPGYFEDVTHAAGIDAYRTGLCCAGNAFRFQPRFSDVDRDGHADILFSSDSRTSQLFWNRGDGTFVDGTLAAGTGTDKSGMGSALGDYDADGDLDWFLTAIFDTPNLAAQPGNRLYRNDGSRQFTDVTTAAGVREAGWGWGTEFFDFDNDGHLDLAATNGFPALGFSLDPTKLWHNNGDGTFADVSIASGVTDTGDGRGLLTLDYDADGDLDLLIVNHAAAPILYRNDGGNSNHWLRISTRGTVSNRDGIGAIVELTPDAQTPNVSQMREISAGGGFLAQSEMTAHFGLGSRTAPVDLVTVRWPSGVVQKLRQTPVDSRAVVVEPLAGDFDADGRVDGDDLAEWSGKFGVEGEAEPCDQSGNSLVDGADLLLWQRFQGTTLPAPAAASIPEPTSIFIASLVAALASCARREQRR